MLLSCSNKQKKRRCGLKPQRQQEQKMNTKMLGMGDFATFFVFLGGNNK